MGIATIVLVANICVTVGHGTLARVLAVGVPWLLLLAAIGGVVWWRRHRSAADAAGTRTEAAEAAGAAHDNAL